MAKPIALTPRQRRWRIDRARRAMVLGAAELEQGRPVDALLSAVIAVVHLTAIDGVAAPAIELVQAEQRRREEGGAP
ncbi:MAG: hypothetical protein GWN84_20690 [Gammaproteobacteria bacterium]|nr:hypothetical protein [Gammaproteobacteria bacterium]NIR85179.1 hypothetical protein [Gammaproteobacteria bacterium]NIU06228.1 hypothetical protein [Gammaproteobacteria bacterium]NIX87501.1 hypothetical protein [Gammaproteobacteria bacterium]